CPIFAPSMATMGQKSSLPQPPHSVSQALTPDTKTPDYRGYSSTKLGDASRSTRSSCSTLGSPGSSGERGGRPVDAPIPRPPASIAPARAGPNFVAAWLEIGCRNECGLAASRTAGLYLYARSASPRAPIYSVNVASVSIGARPHPRVCLHDRLLLS